MESEKVQTLNMASRFGAALILIGLISLVVFILTFQIHQPETMALLLGASLTALGLIILRRAAGNAKRRSARFQTLQRLRRGSEEFDDEN